METSLKIPTLESRHVDKMALASKTKAPS
jgi:hypothetical protein